MRDAKDVKQQYDLICKECDQPFKYVQRNWRGDQAGIFVDITDTYECEIGHIFKIRESALLFRG